MAITLKEALDRVQSDRKADRISGLADLKHVLKYNTNATELRKLKDKSFHSMFEDIFRVITKEKTAYSKASKSNPKSAPDSRLVPCADALRSCVDSLVQRFGAKTLKAIVGHILQTLPTSNGSYCQPLSVPYLKALATILHFPPHAEHLAHTDWTEIVDFCTDGIASSSSDFQTRTSSLPNSGHSRGRERDSRLGLSFTQNSQGRLHRSTDWKPMTEALFESLTSLVTATNSPIFERASSILSTVFDFLASTTSTTGVLNSFRICNRILSRTSLESEQATRANLKAIIPIIKTFWTHKEPGLRDEMLKSLIILKPYLAVNVPTQHDEDLVENFRSLLDVFVDDYSADGRPRRHLTLSDLDLDGRHVVDEAMMPMRNRTYCLRKSTEDSEHNWTLLYFIALLSDIINQSYGPHRQEEMDDGTEINTRKKRKLSSSFEDLVHVTAHGAPATRQYSTQIIATTTNTIELPFDAVRTALEMFLSLHSQSASEPLSWALIGIAGCASQKSARHSTLKSLWLSLWQSIFRLVNSASQGRLACHALTLVIQSGCVDHSDVAESLYVMIDDDGSNAPAGFSDAAVLLWNETIRFLREHGHGNASKRAADRYISWTIRKWLPSSFVDRQYAMQSPQSISPRMILYAIEQCFSSDVAPCNSAYSRLLPIGQTWSERNSTLSLTNYLLLNDDAPTFVGSRESVPKLQGRGSSLVSDANTSSGRIVEHLSAELHQIISTWHDVGERQSKTTTSQSVQMLVCTLLAADRIESLLGYNKTGHLQTMCKRKTQLMKLLCEHLIKSDTSIELTRSALYTVGCVVHAIPEQLESATRSTTHFPSRPLCLDLAEAFESKMSHGGEPDQDIDFDDEPMDVDADPQSLTQGSSEAVDGRRDSTFLTSLSTHNVCVSATMILTISTLEDVEDDIAVVPAAFVKYLVSLPLGDFLAIRPLLLALEEQQYVFTPKDAESIMERLASDLLTSYENERCEVAIQGCMQFMRMTVSSWTDSSNAALADIASQIYDWLIDVCFGRGISSPTVQIGLSQLLFKILETNPDFVSGETGPSVRTNLLRVLKQGQLPVQFSIANSIPGLLSRFVLSQHELIFEDIQNSLPYDMEWVEGLAIRLLVLSRLAITWNTLLRRSVYHIFETAASVASTARHAQFCLKNIAIALNLVNAKDLYQTFSSQLIHTWLNAHPVSSIPFVIFGYTDLGGLIIDSRSELVSQCIMQGNDEGLQEIAAQTGQNINDVVLGSFSQVAAYGLANDAARPSSEPDPMKSIEHRIRNLVGKNAYPKLIAENLPTIVAYLFKRLDHEDSFEKAFARRKGYEQAAKAFAHMKDVEGLEGFVPSSQQPSFPSKFLLDELERIGRRASVDPHSLWTQSLVVIVSRMILDDIRPALGLVQSRKVIRRIRILVALSGSCSIQGYPLEMLLHALRPYLTDKHCARDAIGVCKYLLEAGEGYLAEVPVFVAGTCLAIFLEMRDLISSTQDSTTQESEHRATLSRADTFRSWLDDWAQSFKARTLPKGFHTMLRYAAAVTGDGTAENGSAASKLLLLILSERASSKKLLSRQAADAALALLCNDRFQAPHNFQTDVLGTDEQAAKYATQLWQACREVKIGKSCMRWAARALGRSFSHMGNVPSAMNAETNLTTTRERTNVGNALLSSKAAMLCTFVDQLRSDRRKIVKLAEHVLRRILHTTRETDEGHLIQHHLPPSVVAALLPDVGNVLPPNAQHNGSDSTLQSRLIPDASVPTQTWVHDAALSLLASASDDLFLGEVRSWLERSQDLSQELFPYILHCVLYTSSVLERGIESKVSYGFRQAFKASNDGTKTHVRHLLHALLYLRTQALPQDGTRLQKTLWLDIDYEEAANAAKTCQMLKTALMLVEIDQTVHSQSTATTSRRSSLRQVQRSVPHDLLLSVFRNLDEPDSFHGVPQHPSLEAVADRLAFEGDGLNELQLRGAQNDGAIRRGHGTAADSFGDIINSLARLSMSSLISHLGSSTGVDLGMPLVAQSVAKAAMKLRQWDVSVPRRTDGNSSVLYHTLQSVQLCRTTFDLSRALDEGFANVFQAMNRSDYVGQRLRSCTATLAALTDVDEVLSTRGETDLSLVEQRFEQRQTWMLSSRLEDASQILSARETVLGMLSNNKELRGLLRLDLAAARRMDVRTSLQSSAIFRAHKSLQEALNNVTYLSDVVEPCKNLDIDISGAVRYETAQVLWDRGELLPSIRILQEVDLTKTLEKQGLPVSRPALLATLGHHVSEARSEKPEDVLENYLLRALKELTRAENPTPQDSGSVYHEYGRYCNAQLTSPENVAEMERSDRFTAKRRAEVLELERILGTRLSDTEKHRVKSDRNKSRKWYDIDKTENERLRKSRDQFLRQALEAYLLSLAASNDHDTDKLRFLALWLEHAANPIASESVARQIVPVPTWKFAPLMNQLASRLQDTGDDFQGVMTGLVTRVCLEHPYHGMYYIYAGSRTQGGNDRVALSRNAAAKKISQRLSSDAKTGELWKRICRANDLYMSLACARSEGFKPGLRIALRKYAPSKAIEREVPPLKVPPITLDISLREDCDYSTVSMVDSFKPDMTIAGGLSAPKIVTALTSTGQQCKQLFKAGADDLRQDSIMEQVFDQVSSLLDSQRETRQRKLRVRTYKVIPLDATSGAIEFVQSTMPLNDYLRQAHPHYHPKDLKWDVCRNKVEEVRSRSLDTRVKTFRAITDNFNPVLRHFFFERFEDPDKWFERRLAYTRSTAAISILGHALGLGDRHCQNILLDTSTGEVVHIDLGVAFEAGRILAVPEVVPFRLTRDIVDGFGVMGTEGVYRRCCEFTLEALRNNRDAVMTLLNVLRYDPLYSWSMSPLRAKRLQEEQDREVSEAATAAQSTAAGKSRSRLSDGLKGNGAAEPMAAPKVDADPHDDEGGEADRALSVVERKLAPGLSVMATVNELIQSATDEKNLAVLFCGWAAYA